jgi:IS5 family transposase
MSTDMCGIYQPSLFAKSLAIWVSVPESSRYRVLADILPWPRIAEVANKYRGRHVSLIVGRPLDMRLHLGAYVAQSMNGWTDRETEEMIRYHAGVRVLCGLSESSDSSDRTSVEKFRNQIGPEGADALNQIIVDCAAGAGFTGSGICAADTTVQEAPIQHPTEVGHMKKIMDKLVGIGKKIGGNVAKTIAQLGQKAQDAFTEIRLFTRGKANQAIEKKKKLSRKMYGAVKNALGIVQEKSSMLPKKAQQEAKAQAELFRKMLGQIIKWLKTGKHPAGKLISLWNQEARAITRNKASKSVEFGRRWLITRLLGGYVIGAPCSKLGGDADVKIADEVVINFLDNLGELPEAFVYDRGGDGPKNHELLKNLGVDDCIFPKGRKKMDVAPAVFDMARRERALSEASIAALKHNKYGFNKPRARLPESCTLKGFSAMFGFNTNHLVADVFRNWEMTPDIT